MDETKELDAPDLLRQAAALIERALIQFDVRESPCLECGRPHYRNMAHWKVYQQFTDMPTKLHGAADKLQETGAFVRRDTYAARQARQEIDGVRRSETRKRSAPWEGRGRRE